jgi:selenoprotein W-related protein
MNDPHKPRITITYCRQCQWLLRAGWMAQELLSTFADDLGEVALLPAAGGIFQIHYEGDLLWDRKRDGGFPDAKTLKQRVRDRLDPGRELGHIDRA